MIIHSDSFTKQALIMGAAMVALVLLAALGSYFEDDEDEDESE